MRDAPGGERAIEIAGQRPQRAAGLVAIEALIAIGDEPLGQRRLAGAREAHDDHDLGVVSRRRCDDAITTQQARRRKRVIEQLPVGAGQHDLLRARRRHRCFDTRDARKRNDHVREVVEPGDGDVER